MPRPSVYRLGPGDVVAVLIQGEIGDFSTAKVHMPDSKDPFQLPAVGHPLVVLPDGTLPMPLIDPIPVAGLTVSEARQKAADRKRIAMYTLAPFNPRCLDLSW